MFNIDVSIVAMLIANPGFAYVLSNGAVTVLNGKMYFIPGDFDGMNEDDFNRYIQNACA